MVMLRSHADPTEVGLAGLQLRLGHLPRRCLLWWLRSADGVLPVADFAPNCATLGSLVDQRPQLSSRIRCSGLLSPEAADFVLEFADAGSGLSDAGFGLLGAGELVLGGEDGPLRRWVDPE